MTAKSFNSVFQIKLREEVGDISYGFPAKWSQIEKAFFAALGSDQVIKRYNKFFDEGPSTHGGKPMEQIISDVENQVDKCFGRDPINKQYRLGKKYKLIFIIAQNIPVEFKQMRTHILLKSGTELN